MNTPSGPAPKIKAPPTLALVPPAAAKAYKPNPDLLQSLDTKVDHIRAVLYGDHGMGKTSSMASLAARGLVWVVDCENSVRRSALAKIGVETDNIRLWPDWTYDGLQQFHVTAKAQLEQEPGSIYAVAIDSLTALAHYWLEASVLESLARPAMIKKHPDRPPWDVFQDDYGALAEKMRALVTRKLYTLPCHVVITAHARRAENEDGIIRIGPDLSPAVLQSVLTYSDWVLRMTIKRSDDEVTRITESQPVGQVEAKDRYNVLGGRLEDHDLLDMIDLWEDHPF